MTPETSLRVQVNQCLELLCISSLCEWDALVFLSHHRCSLTNAEYISGLLGYTHTAVAEALDKLAIQEFISRSYFSQSVRMYRVLEWKQSSAQAIFEDLTSQGTQRAARLAVAQELRKRRTVARMRPRAGLHFA